MRWTEIFRKEAAIVVLLTLGLILFVNGLFVALSPTVMSFLPSNLVGRIHHCHRSYFQAAFPLLGTPAYDVFYGDSHVEGVGDEFLQGAADYGLIRKLIPAGQTGPYLNYGRSGYGNASTVHTGEWCARLIQRWTLAQVSNDAARTVTLVFYEGNDLNNNLDELRRPARPGSPPGDDIRFLAPLFDLIIGHLRDLKNTLMSARTDAGRSHPESADPKASMPAHPVSLAGVRVGVYPQSAATELSPRELDEAFALLERSLVDLKTRHPKARFLLLYLPSVASTYHFSGDLPVQSYEGHPYHLTSGETNRAYSDRIRARVLELATTGGWQFCDATQDLLDRSSEGVPLHGPSDWKHFNRAGYDLIAKKYDACLRAP